MKFLCILFVLCAVGCSLSGRSNVGTSPEEQDQNSVVLTDLVYVDMFSLDYTTQHPLVCGTDGELPDGKEMAFRLLGSRESVHVVFPQGVTPPNALDGTFVLHGRYQSIQRKAEEIEGRLAKRPPKGYRYFIVSSWEKKK